MGNMREKSIRLSKEHGVNLAIPICYFCGEEKNEIVLAGRLPQDVEAPKHAVWDKNPCDKCKELMRMGIMLISVRDGESGENPYRTGRMVVVKEENALRMFGEVDDILKSRVGFVEDSVWTLMGLPQNGEGEK